MRFYDLMHEAKRPFDALTGMCHYLFFMLAVHDAALPCRDHFMRGAALSYWLVVGRREICIDVLSLSLLIVIHMRRARMPP